MLSAGIAAYAQTGPGTGDSSGIEYIDIIHCTHTDYGFTDHPYIVEELQQRFLDIAIDAADATSHLPAGKRFYWTAEALDIVWKWWENASPERRSLLEKLIHSGQIDVSALPFNVHPFLNPGQWDLAVHWVPEELWEKFNPEVGIQNDVNGFSRAGVIRLLDRGIKYFWIGINTYWGGTPFPPPEGFWWKMPDGRKILVWQSFPYWYGYNFFHEKDWRFVQQNASNTQFRTPRIDDIFKSDEESIRKAHSICMEKINQLRQDGYAYDFITFSITNQWRIDNDGPFPPLVDFVNQWNELNLKPEIRLTTASYAMKRIEKRLGENIPVYEGEWPDWWAFGGAASPRELAAARSAGNYAEAVLSPVWGAKDENTIQKVHEIDRSLSRYWEHTFASNQSSSDPFGFFNLGLLAEKNIYAYRPYEEARWLAARKTRKYFTNQPEGLYVINTGDADYTGWIELDKFSFRGIEYRSVKEPVTNEVRKLDYNGRNVRFWIRNLAGNSHQRFLLSKDSAMIEKYIPVPDIELDQFGWPLSIRWEGMDQPLFSGETGTFLSIESTVGRQIESEIWEEKDSRKRLDKVHHITSQRISTVKDSAEKRETPFSFIYTQEFYHPRLKYAKRILEVWKDEPRIAVDIQFDRLSSSNPEIFYIEFTLPDLKAFPLISNGGEGFRPYIDQIPGTCTDFFAFDGWVNYPAQNGSWLWSGRDAALISFSAPQLAVKGLSPPQDMNTILSMVYNNLWEVNFLNDCPGKMQFHFDLVYKNHEITTKEAHQIVRTYNLPPLIMLNPATREDNHTFERLNEIGRY